MPRFPSVSLRLSRNWRRVLRHAWSVRFIALAALLSFLEVMLQFVGASLPFPSIMIALLTAAVSSAALVARIVAQKDVSE